jgi:2-polyprenyl-3-methyl-5-hydroxy-6-metoxy-1,4-benzoquinol methylase
LTTREFDQKKAEEFTGRVLADTAATTTTILATIGDRLGLFKDLAVNGPATSAELASRTGTDERYVREWLGAMFAAGYVDYDGANGRFSLPPEHEPTLVQEPGPAFLAGVQQELMGCLRRVDIVENAFRNGGGVALDEYPDEMWIGMDRFTAQWHENMLVQEWIPLLPEVEAKLRSGARVADIGCGRGRAVIKLAQTFPDSTYTGYDVVESNIQRARENAAAAGVADRVRFEALDAAEGLPERYDVITTFDVIHDAVDPLALLRSIHDALEPSGIYVCLDINCSDRLEDNVGTVASLFYGFSIMLCMTSSLARGGAGLGTLGLHPKKLEELAHEAGFHGVRLVEMDNPFNNLYELRP